jgi:hypothetical protein
LQLLRERLSNCTCLQDDIEDIFTCVYLLAVNEGVARSSVRELSPFGQILKQFPSMHVSDGEAIDPVHWNFLQQLLHRIGGPQKIKSFGIAWWVTV